MSTMTNATDLAIRTFNEFVGAWIGPAAQRYLFDPRERATGRVTDAIQAIAAGENRPPPCGYVVCRRDTVERTDRDHRNGFIYSPLSAIFERLDQAQNVMEGCGKREGHYVICEIQEWRP